MVTAISDLYQLAIFAYSHRDFVQSEHICKAIHNRQPKDFRTLNFLPVNLSQRQRNQASADCLYTAPQVKTDNPEVHHKYRFSLRDLNDLIISSTALKMR